MLRHSIKQLLTAGVLRGYAQGSRHTPPLTERILPFLIQQHAYFSAAASNPDFRAKVYNSLPRSLAADVATDAPAPGVEENWFTRFLLKLAGFYTKESQHIRGAKALYVDVVQQATDKRLFDALGLEYRFANVHAMLGLHVWLLLVRLRAEGQDGAELAQMLYENFTEDVEARVRAEGVRVRLGRWLAELEKMFFGSCLSYDKALRGEADLKEALLRNVYGNDAGKEKEAAILAKYLTRELACLSKTDSHAVMTGKIQFSNDLL